MSKSIQAIEIPEKLKPIVDVFDLIETISKDNLENVGQQVIQFLKSYESEKSLIINFIGDLASSHPRQGEALADLSVIIYNEFFKDVKRKKIENMSEEFVQLLDYTKTIEPSEEEDDDEYEDEPIIQYYDPNSLEFALIHDNIEVLQAQSTKSNFNVNKEIDDVSLIEYAAQNGSINCFKLLQEKGAKLTDKIDYYACLGGNIEIAEILLSKGYKFNECFEYAIKSHNNKFADWLLAHNIESKDISVAECINNLNIRAFLFFLANNGNINDRDISTDDDDDYENGDTALMYASQYGSKLLVEFIVENCGDIKMLNFYKNEDKLDKTALHFACEAESVSVIKYLIENSADVNARALPSRQRDSKDHSDRFFGETPFHVACRIGNIDICNILLENGADINMACENGELSLFPIHFACMSGNLEVVQKLIELKADVNAKCNAKIQPIHYAVQSGNEQIISLLLSLGADINSKAINYGKKSHGVTPLHIAILTHSIEMVEFLMENSADVNEKIGVFNGKKNLHPVQLATIEDCPGIVEKLLEKVTDVNIQDDNGMTMMMTAADNKAYEIAEMLIDKSPDLKIIDNRKFTAIAYAKRAKADKIVDLIAKHGGNVNPNPNNKKKQNADDLKLKSLLL